MSGLLEWTFECLVIVTIVLLGLAEMFAALVVGRALGLRIEGGYIGGLTVMNLVLARLAVDGILKRFGLSRSGKTVEKRGRTVAIPEGSVGDDEVVEVRCAKSFVMALGVASLICCLVIVLILALIPHHRMEGVGYAYLLIAFFGLMAAHCFYEWWWGTPQAWANSSGVSGLPVGFHMRPRFVPWSAVATCEIETYYDTFGKPVIVRPILKGWHGEALLTLNLLYTKMEDQERLVNYIKAKLPKPKPMPEDDLWE